jgi:hypothetical protein
MPKTQQEIIQQGYQALVNALGVVDAIRFIQHFTPGQGDYTRDRHQWLDKIPLEDILKAMQQVPAFDTAQYEEIIE